MPFYAALDLGPVRQIKHNAQADEALSRIWCSLLLPLCIYFLDTMIFKYLLQFDIHPEKAAQVRPNRPLKPPPPAIQKATGPSPKPSAPSEDIPCSSA